MKNANRRVSETDVCGEKILGPKIVVNILDRKCLKWKHSVKQLTNLISKRSVSKNTKMELTLDAYIKFNVVSVPSDHSSQNNFLSPRKWV